MSSDKKSRQLLARAKEKIPGAVNSPVRAWKAVGGSPRFAARGRGVYLFDADDNEFFDYVAAYGPAILGHAHPAVTNAIAAQAKSGLGFGATIELEVELSEIIGSAIVSAERIRLVSSGTEAGMTALRIARAATARNSIIKFDGCYHGHSDSLLVRAGSGAMTLGVPDSAGVPPALAALTKVAAYNSIDSVAKIFAENPGDIAAIIVEPVAANMGVVPPGPEFLKELEDLAHREGALLICDEVITGFRLSFGSISEKMGVRPDLLMLGKIIGGGLPIGAVAGPAKYMDLLAPLGPVYQAGTLSGNPLSVRAGIETLKILRDDPAIYERLENLGARLEAGMRDALMQSEIRGCVNRAGSLLTLFLGVSRVRNADDAHNCDSDQFSRFFHAMLDRGVNIAPSQFEAMFISDAHSIADIDHTVAVLHESLAEVARR